MAVNGPYCRDVQCPFYRGGDSVCIKCEGPFDDCLGVQMHFNCRATMLIHLKTFCADKYQKCEIYRMIYQAKYDDQ